MTLKPRLLDGCCGAGGAARGYVTAGFEVWGTDIDGRLATDYELSGGHWLGTAHILGALRNVRNLRQFSAVHVSPPCQFYSQMSRCRPGLAKDYPDLIGPVRELLERSGVPYVIENVAAARPWLKDPITLCGQMFGKHVYRHRLFEAGNGITLTAPAAMDSQTATERVNSECGWPHPVPAARAGHWKPGYYVSVSGHERKEPVRAAMAIDWMRNRDDVAEAVPPYMTHEIGRQILEQL
jgi:DNA (cytosine-5)-methyltransferase 1